MRSLPQSAKRAVCIPSPPLVGHTAKYRGAGEWGASKLCRAEMDPLAASN